MVLSANQGCAVIARTIPATWTPTPVYTFQPTETLTTGFIATADYLETASVKGFEITDQPTSTTTPTPVPIGVFALLFYPPLIMNYGPLFWQDKSNYPDRQFITNYLQSRELPKCTVGVQGPTDFNGPHTSEVIQLGTLKYTVLSFPDSLLDFISQAYLADPSLATEAGLPVFWVSSKSDEWNECKSLAEDVLATLHSPVH